MAVLLIRFISICRAPQTPSEVSPFIAGYGPIKGQNRPRVVPQSATKTATKSATSATKPDRGCAAQIDNLSISTYIDKIQNNYIIQSPTLLTFSPASRQYRYKRESGQIRS